MTFAADWLNAQHFACRAYIVSVVFDRNTIRDAMVYSEYSTAAHCSRTDFLLQLCADVCLRTHQCIFIYAALERKLFAILLSHLDYVHAGTGFTGVEHIDAAVEYIVHYWVHVTIAVV